MRWGVSDAYIITLKNFFDLPWIKRKGGNVRLLDMDGFGEPVDDEFRGAVGGVSHWEHVAAGVKLEYGLLLFTKEWHLLDDDVSR